MSLLFVSAEQAATVANVSVRHIHNLCAREDLKSVRVGRCLRIPVNSLCEFLGITPEQVAEVLNAA